MTGDSDVPGVGVWLCFQHEFSYEMSLRYLIFGDKATVIKMFGKYIERFPETEINRDKTAIFTAK